jgi:hypothetical protein
VPERVRPVGRGEDGYRAAERIRDFRHSCVYAERAETETPDRAVRRQEGRVALDAARADGFDLRTRSRDGMIVASSVSDARGWRVRIDGRPAEALEANWAFVGFRAPAGVHRVELRYAPASWHWGLALFALTLGVLAGLGFRAGVFAAARRRAARLIATAARRRAGSGAP